MIRQVPACVKDGLVAGAVAGLLGGAPSAILLSWSDLDQSIQAIAHLVPGNSHVTSPWGRRALGGTAHMGLSLAFATLYSCKVKGHPIAFGVGLWAVNIKLLAPRSLREEDRSYALADHIVWALVVDASLKKVHRRQVRLG